nr:Thioredoxin domain [uncultured bacterium]
MIAVDGANFARDVLERSKQVPVMVDFWAAWCGPCRSLGPVLERLAGEYGGGFVLAKIDSDRSPELARQYGVRGIPAVKLFVDGEVRGEFTGALPESQVRRFLDKNLPAAADKLVLEARSAGDARQAAELYSAALAEDPGHVAALLGLAGLLLDGGENEAAKELFERLKPSERESQAAKLLAARLMFSKVDGDLAQLEAEVADNPGDLGARMALGEALVARERYAEGMDRFLEVVGRDRKFGDDAGRKAMIRVFDLLGPGHPLIGVYRSKLSTVLFS